MPIVKQFNALASSDYLMWALGGTFLGMDMFLTFATLVLTAVTLGGVNNMIIPTEPPLPGIMAGIDRPKLIMAQDIDWPPYAYLAKPPEGDFTVAGFGHDIVKGMGKHCNMEVDVA